MRRREILAAAIVTALSPSRALGATSGGGVVALVTADLESHVVAVELASGRVVRRIPTAPGPRSVESSRFGSVVVAHTEAGLVSVLDSATLAVRRVLHGFGEPRYTAMHPTERLAYVTDSARGEVVTVDLVRGAIVHRLRVPGPARHVSLDGDRRLLWTALGSKAARVAVVDLSDARRPRLRRTFAPPFPAHDVVVAPGGNHVWITSGSRSAIAVYRSEGGTPRVLAADGSPQHVAFGAGRAFVASGVDGRLRAHRLDGEVVRSARVPAGSYNLTYAATSAGSTQAAVVSPSLDRGTVCVLTSSGVVRFVHRVARSAHDVCVVRTG